MNTPIEKRVEALEKKLADLARLITSDPTAKPGKDWRRTFGMSANDPGFDEMIRLGKEYRQAQRAEDEPDADSGH